MKNVTVIFCMVDPKILQDQSDFRTEEVEKYSMVTLGGNHLRTAAKELKEEGRLPSCITKLDV